MTHHATRTSRTRSVPTLATLATHARAAFAALLCLASPGAAQVSGTGTIEVFITDAKGLAVPGVAVTASAVDVTTTRTAVTDDAGRAILNTLEPSARYIVKTDLQGFTPTRADNVLVRTGQTATLRVPLEVGTVSEAVQVSAETAAVDIRSATVGADITLRLTESLPTGRSFQDYLQLVPSVLPDDPSASGNPAAKSGLNYSDLGGAVGTSSDNFYFFNGINVTDPDTGTFGANLNTEIIQEQKVLTGGIPAEYPGTAGLLTNVITKSGTKAYHGSANYFFQNSDLVAENENTPAQGYSTYDSAFTIGGPALRDRAWFFGSYRRFSRQDDVTALDTLELMRTVKNDQNQGYAKGTWTPSRNDTVSATFLNDPTTVSGRRDRSVLNTRDYRREQGGNRFALNYSRVMGPALIDLAYTQHNSALSDFSAIAASANTIVFEGSDTRTLADQQLGGYGQSQERERGTKGFSGRVQWTAGMHLLKGGFDWSRNAQYRNSLYVNGSTWTSLANHLAGTTAGALSNGDYSALVFDVTTTSDYNGLLRTIDGLPNRADFYRAYDGNGDGVISQDELGVRLAFGSASGNPDGRINYSRTIQTQDGPQDTRSDGLSFFFQDQIQLKKFTFNAGLRTEQWKHFATTGANIYTFEWTLAPRLSATYDLLGNGRQKLAAYYGRYYDPIRTNMTNFAGTLTGAVNEEQVFINNQWVTYRIRGGAVQQDAFFSPTTRTPYTDDTMVGWEADLGRNMSVSSYFTHRRTRNILEDYDLGLYARATDGSTTYPGNIDAPGSLWLGLDYFGYAENPGSNFVIGTLAGGKRDYNGLELAFRKRYADRWQALVSYSYSRARGNTNSDSSADYQGDVIFLDPRAPNQYGPQPGSIPHLFKAAGSYTFPIGVEVGANYRWNSGTIRSTTFLASSRHLPLRVSSAEAYDFNGATARWIADGSVGGVQDPSWGQMDLRLKYQKAMGRFTPEVFLDVFNLFDNQGSIAREDLFAGEGSVSYLDPIRWLDPRRMYVGVRLNF